jgi:hypothetical protein
MDGDIKNARRDARPEKKAKNVAGVPIPQLFRDARQLIRWNLGDNGPRTRSLSSNDSTFVGCNYAHYAECRPFMHTIAISP